jgi:dTDP-4-amino-4,6-dideoxygalactose transaminase
VAGELTPEGLLAALPEAPGPVAVAMPVAVMGRPMSPAAWRAFQDATGVKVIIDAAAGFDAATSAEVPVMVSLHATKTLGVGEGGFIASEDPEFSTRLRAMTTPSGAGGLVWFDLAGNARISAGTTSGNSAVMEWLDPKGEQRIAAGTEADGTVIREQSDPKPE